MANCGSQPDPAGAAGRAVFTIASSSYGESGNDQKTRTDEASVTKPDKIMMMEDSSQSFQACASNGASRRGLVMLPV